MTSNVVSLRSETPKANNLPGADAVTSMATDSMAKLRSAASDITDALGSFGGIFGGGGSK